MAGISFEHMTKRFPDGFEAVKDVNLEVAEWRVHDPRRPFRLREVDRFALVAGLEEITEGVLNIGDEVVNGRQPKDRDLAMVFQNYAPYPLVIGACAGLAVRELAIGPLVVVLAVGDAYSPSASTGPRPSSRHPNGDRRGEP